MPSVTISGTVAGQFVSFLTSTALQTQLGQQIINSAFPGTLFAGTTGTISSGATVDVTPTGSVLTGNPNIPNEAVLLGGQFGSYFTGASSPPVPTFSTVVATDNSNSSIVNNNPLGGLTAVTGAGGNVLLGLTGLNAFTTGNGGQDIVVLNGAANTLTSNGSDAVLVGGPSTITAAANGIDNVLVTTGTSLTFINGSRLAADTITGAANSVTTLAGFGSTSIAAGAGPEAFFVDTGAGNVTLNGNLGGLDAFNFVKDAATTPGAASVIVNNFVSGDTVGVRGYAGAQYTIGAATSGVGSTLLLTDGSSVTFTNLSAAALAGVVRPV